jgi:PiT family inorganic phosphate transporter
VSTTHTIVGAVVGVGLARGIAAVDRKIVTNIFYSWLITIPFAAVICLVLYPLIKFII